ncbi:oxygen-independent coproporphyrinogen III oxidase (plasmid) [Sphingomonas panni]|uniref:oxygen-independent coproporphyrinogen III oxidase n=1 Tax=Sphingomonas panni TaxID=237612 RepID=UPI0037046B97
MWTYHPDLLARPVPRYTSYPTAAEFTSTVDGSDLASGLSGVRPNEDISLYLHIPYCREICWYCGCNTGAATKEARLTAYIDRLHDEVDLVAAHLGGRGQVRRIAFGGGSPNAIAQQAFSALLQHVKRAFDCFEPIVSVELDPRGFDEGWASTLADAGVRRASLGVQTFDPAIQAAIGRVQPHEHIGRTVELLRQAGIDSLNFDLMYGLPGQDVASLAGTLEAALAFAPDRLAVFGYAHVPQLIPRQRRIDASRLPGPEQRFQQAAYAYELLLGRDYRAVGFDHFARAEDPLALASAEGRLRRNFQAFTDDAADYVLGLGSSAISALPDRLLQNEKNTGRWHLAVGAGRLPVERGSYRSPDDQARGLIIEQILTRGSADLTPLLDRACYRAPLLDFERRGLLAWEGARIVLTDGALPYARAVAARIDAYRDQSTGRFSNAI